MYMVAVLLMLKTDQLELAFVICLLFCMHLCWSQQSLEMYSDEGRVFIYSTFVSINLNVF
jgi:hypothetical protein